MSKEEKKFINKIKILYTNEVLSFGSNGDKNSELEYPYELIQEQKNK